jgi:hypothetical protein
VKVDALSVAALVGADASFYRIRLDDRGQAVAGVLEAVFVANPFPLPELKADLGSVRDYWRSLVRGANDIPFWDDFAPNKLGEQSARCMLLDVFEKPLRFRFNSVVGSEIEQRYGEAVRDRFCDEVDTRPPFDFLNAQGSATIELRGPTLFTGVDYSRLLLPMWGDGRISMVLVAFAWR